MDVSAVSSPNVYPVAVVEPEDIFVEEPVVSDGEASESAEAEDDAEGVLRLLQEGHFKG